MEFRSVLFRLTFIFIFGKKDLGVRMLFIFLGVGIFFLMYFFCKRLFILKICIIAVGITAFSPWDISLSRGGFEAHLALFLALLGTYLFLIAREKRIFYILSAISFGLTLHTYPTFKLSLLLFLPALVWLTGLKENLLPRNRMY